jgi:hypothetical protein
MFDILPKVLESPFELSESVGLIDFSVRFVSQILCSANVEGVRIFKRKREYFFICYNICGKGSSSSIAKK